jgi:hypothetical protein
MRHAAPAAWRWPVPLAEAGSGRGLEPQAKRLDYPAGCGMEIKPIIKTVYMGLPVRPADERCA